MVAPSISVKPPGVDGSAADRPNGDGQVGRTEVTIQGLADRLAALEEKETRAGLQPQVAPTVLEAFEAPIAELTRIVSRTTLASESIAKSWMAVPGVIGVVVVLTGLGILLSAFAFVQDFQFETALWGGVVLVTVGALSATASALAAKPVGGPSSGPTMPPIHGR